MNQQLEDYVLNHTQNDDEVLLELTRQTHIKMLYANMLSGPLQGKLLEMLSKMIQPKNILELGTFTGYSAICLAKGLQDKGKLHTIEVNDEITDFAALYFKKAGFENKIQQHIGDALDIISKLDMKFDLVFIDADKKQYLEYYNSIFDKVNPGGYIIADNVLWYGKVVGETPQNDISTKAIKEFNDFVHNDNRVENVLLPIRDGLMILRVKS